MCATLTLDSDRHSDSSILCGFLKARETRMDRSRVPDFYLLIEVGSQKRIGCLVASLSPFVLVNIVEEPVARLTQRWATRQQMKYCHQRAAAKEAAASLPSLWQPRPSHLPPNSPKIG